MCDLTVFACDTIKYGFLLRPLYRYLFLDVVSMIFKVLFYVLLPRLSLLSIFCDLGLKA